MIAINVLILVILVFEHGNQACDTAEVYEPKSFSSFLRRRRTSSNAIESDPPTFKANADAVPETKVRKFFGLRQPQPIEQQLPRTKSNERLPAGQVGYFSYLLSGVTKAFDVIESLEKEYDEKLEKKKLKEMDLQFPLLARDSIVSRLLAGSLKTFDVDDEIEDGSDSGSSEYIPQMAASGITINDNDLDEAVDENHDSDENEIQDGDEYESQDGIDDELVYISEPFDGGIEQDTSGNTASFAAIDSEIRQNGIKSQDEFEKLSACLSISPENNEEKIQSDYIILSDSDSESWEKVERNMIENVVIMSHRPQVVVLLEHLANKQNLIDFLAVVFVKLARRIFLRPPSAVVPSIGNSIICSKTNPFPSLNKHDSSDDFVEVPREGEEHGEGEGDDELRNEHRFLDFETAQKALFNVDISTETDDWEVIPLSTEDFTEAMEYITIFVEKDKDQIEIDLPRLPVRYYSFYAERRGRELLETDAEELRNNIKSLLAFILAFEEKEEIVSSVDGGALTTVSTKDQRIIYTQGFDQVVAYFAINFDLKCAGTIAYRFFQLYMAEIINVESDQFRNIVSNIDARAIKMIRGYLRDQIGATVLNFEVLLGILEHYPFSDKNATIFYFNSATNLIDLDRLIRFLVLRVPHSQAHKSISLLAAANMLYSMLALDKLFMTELGSEEWTQFKNHLNDSNTRRSDRIEILEYLVSRFMGEIYLFMGDKIIHDGEEFDEFLEAAQSLIPYLHEFN